MRLAPYYKHANRNVGRIKAVDNAIGKVTLNINAGHGGGDVVLESPYCYQFTPQVDDRIMLCVDEDGDIPGFILTKRNKSRQARTANQRKQRVLRTRKDKK